ncbi:MAG: NADP-dependent malic enzyme [Candidatus Parcubacteria bacterium]|nr:NADP-dependent malic enzyme [Candidatus Parcubacteria bacterium]
MDIKTKALQLHKQFRGKIETKLKMPLENKEDLSWAYTPGVAEPCKEIQADKSKVYDYTNKGNLVAIVTDGSAVLGLGNIGAEAGYPVMEGKAALFKKFANVDAIPLCLNTQDTEEIIKVVKSLEPTFGGINLEDISAPRCFEIEKRLKEEMKIPVFHDDQHGTAIVVLAGLINALKIVNKKASDIKVVISGAGAAGLAICKILLNYGVKDIITVDSKGAIYQGRQDLNWAKEEIAKQTNLSKISGGLDQVLAGADVFIGVSGPNIMQPEWVKAMKTEAIIFAMANPVPEVDPQAAKQAGASVVATGRSDWPNQINNVLAFPGLFRGVLDARAGQITEKMKLAAAFALANLVSDKELNSEYIIPQVFDPRVAPAVAEAVKKAI